MMVLQRLSEMYLLVMPNVLESLTVVAYLLHHPRMRTALRESVAS